MTVEDQLKYQENKIEELRDIIANLSHRCKEMYATDRLQIATRLLAQSYGNPEDWLGVDTETKAAIRVADALLKELGVEP